MTATALLCESAGLTVKKVAERAGVQPSYLARCVNKGCPLGTADALTQILQCDPRIFLWGYKHWHKHFGHTGVARSDTLDEVTTSPAPVERRRHILKSI